MSYSALIVDDEKNATIIVRDLLLNLFPNKFSKIDFAYSKDQAVHFLKGETPDIVFLDIVISGGTGFMVLEELKDKNLNVIFISAYSDYAVKAFEVSAFHYLLKPIIESNFTVAVNRVFDKKLAPINYKPLLANINAKKPVILAIPDGDETHIIPISDIVRFESDNRYCTIFLSDNSNFLTNRTIGSYSELLESSHFFQTNRSNLINLKQVKLISRGKKSVTLKNGNVVQIAREKITALVEAIENLPPD